MAWLFAGHHRPSPIQSLLAKDYALSEGGPPRRRWSHGVGAVGLHLWCEDSGVKTLLCCLLPHGHARRERGAILEPDALLRPRRRRLDARPGSWCGSDRYEPFTRRLECVALQAEEAVSGRDDRLRPGGRCGGRWARDHPGWQRGSGPVGAHARRTGRGVGSLSAGAAAQLSGAVGGCPR
jgi:hypothetical protein